MLAPDRSRRPALRKRHASPSSSQQQLKRPKIRSTPTSGGGEEENFDESELEKIDPLLAAEDKEIKRLEKLLGLDKSKNSNAK